MALFYKNLNDILPEDMVMDTEVNDIGIEITDAPVLETGEYIGRIGGFSRFTSKDKQNHYVRLTIGTVKNFDGKKVVFEVDRVWMEQFYNGCDLVNVLTSLGAVEGRKAHPERLINKPVKFVIKANETASPDSKYPFMIADIEAIEKLPEELDFKYIRVATDYGFKYVPVTTDAKPSPKLEIKGFDDNPKIELPEDDEDFFNFDEE